VTRSMFLCIGIGIGVIKDMMRSIFLCVGVIKDRMPFHCNNRSHLVDILYSMQLFSRRIWRLGGRLLMI